MSRSSLLFLSAAAAVLGGLIGLGALTAHDPGTSGPVLASPEHGTPLPYRLLEPAGMEVPRTSSGATKPVTVGENFQAADGPLETDAFEIVLAPGAWVEYKASMDQGDALVYTWAADGRALSFDFHADLPDSQEGFFTRYEAGSENRSSGSIVAPYSGLHGWYWKNEGDEPIKIQLRVAGFYHAIHSAPDRQLARRSAR